MTGRLAMTAGVVAALALAAGAPIAASQTLSAPSSDSELAAVGLTPLNEPTTSYILKPGDTLWGLADKYFLRRPAREEVRVRRGAEYVRRLEPGLELIVPSRLLRVQPVDAKLGAFRGDVTITGDTTSVAQLGMPVREGAVISTGPNAFARIDLPDGSRVSIPSQSRVRLSVLQKVLLSAAIERTFTVEDGRGEAAKALAPQRRDSYVIRSPMSVAAVRSPDFQLAYDAAAKTAHQGMAKAQAKEAESAELAVVGQDEPRDASETGMPLLPSPALHAFRAVQDGPTVTLDLEPVAGAKAYRVRLARDAGMKTLVAEQTQGESRFAFPGLDDGDYFLRVSAIGPTDLEGRAKIYAFQRDLNAISPIGVTTEGDGTDRRFVLRWRTIGEGARAYRVQVFMARSAAEPFIDEGGLDETQLTLVNLPPGDYRWRVMSATARRGGLVEKWTEPETFTVPAH